MTKAPDEKKPQSDKGGGIVDRILGGIEAVGNRLPDPAVLFLLLLFATWAASAVLAPVEFTEIDPRSGEPLRIRNQLTATALTEFLAGRINEQGRPEGGMVRAFTGFAPLGVVLVALLGIGVAEKAGFISAGIKMLLGMTAPRLLTPMLLLAAIVSHSAADAGYVLVIPLGGVIFYAAGRHPLAGVAAAFAGVSGGFAANFIPSGLDPLLQGFTQQAAQILDPARQVNPLSNLAFTAASSLLVIGIGWYLTDRVVEPRLRATAIDGDPDAMPKMEALTDADRRGFRAASAALLAGLLLLALVMLPESSPWRAGDGSLTNFGAPAMRMLVPLIFLLFLIPGIVHGYAAGTFRTHRDVIAGMTEAMGTMSYYLVMAFFAAQFIAAFGASNIGVLIALKGANFLRDLNLFPQVTIVGIVLLTAGVNLVLGSASAKWAILSVIFVPMLMELGIAPELTQAAYRIGDSTTNIVTPLMPYFPLVVVFCQRYVKATGIGTVVSLMLPYSAVLLASWTLFLVVYWLLGLPLGIQGAYVYQ